MIYNNIGNSPSLIDRYGRLTDTIDMVLAGVVLNIEAGQWYSFKCLESGTVLLETKGGAYRPLEEDEIMNFRN